MEKEELSLKSKWKHFFVSLLGFILLPLIPLLTVLMTNGGEIETKEWYFVTFCFVINIAVSSKDGLMFWGGLLSTVLLMNVYFNLGSLDTIYIFGNISADSLPRYIVESPV